MDDARTVVVLSGDATEMMSKVTPTQIVVDLPITPEPFHGDAHEDAENCTEQFEHVTSGNGFDAARKL